MTISTFLRNQILNKMKLKPTSVVDKSLVILLIMINSFLFAWFVLKVSTALIILNVTHLFVYVSLALVVKHDSLFSVQTPC